MMHRADRHLFKMTNNRKSKQTCIVHFFLISILCFATVGGIAAPAGNTPTSSSILNNAEVSFFGSSHVSARLQEARSTSDVYFRLRTRRSDSMLFLAAGRTDYCLLVLDAGRLKVHINLGAGETEIASDSSFLLNDMKWHSVNLTRRGAQITIQVDEHITKANLPTRFHELNIHFGVWVGGLNGFNEIFLGNLPSFRGCMSHITYNSEDVLLRAKTQPGEINGITWNCSEEFDASASDSFAFTTPTSYITSRVAIPRQGTTIQMNVLTSALNGLIFYVTGLSSRPDFLVLQLREGKPQFVVELGTGPVHIQTTLNITDSLWHSVKLVVSPTLLSIIVDNMTWTSDPPLIRGGGSRQLDVSEMIYLGGVEDAKKSKLKSLGVIDQSFMGCMERVVIDGTSYGLPHVDVSRGISKGCSGYDGCYSANSVEETRSHKNIKCEEATLREGRNNMTSARAVNKSNGTTIVKLNGTRVATGGGGGFGANKSGSSSNVLDVITISRDVIRVVTQTSLGELEIMRLSPVQVAEGDSAIITPRHLAITLDLSKYGIRESGVLLRISKPPQEGRIEVTTRTGTGGNTGSSSTLRRTETFALLDVGAGRVRYFHNGAESSKDSIELVLRLVQTPGYLLPAYLQDERAFTLPIEITPVNDPPEIRLVPGGVLRLAERTKIRLTPGIITALDPDTSPAELQFTLISTGLPGEKRGILELSSEPGRAIQTFTQEDLEEKRVWYVDQGVSSSKLALKVTDGSSTSSPAILRVETFSLRIVPEMNTGLEVANTIGTTSFIASANLSFTSNAIDQGLVIEYHVVRGPKYGLLQLKKINGQWTNTEEFTQHDLGNKGVRYLLQRPSDVAAEDEFSFHVSLGEVKIPTEFRFRFKIVSLRLEQGGSNLVILNGTSESLISTRQLNYHTFPIATADTSIKYTIVRAPLYGFLSLRFSNSSVSNHIRSFTQADVVAKRVFYQFQLLPLSAMRDAFMFNISTTSQAVLSGPYECQIQHLNQRKSIADILTVKPLKVTEGTKEFLTNSLMRSTSIRRDWYSIPFHFNITTSPEHGTIGMQKSASRTSTNILSFTSNELERGLIYYQHDGSESSSDSIPMIAWNSQVNFMLQVNLDVTVIGINNHAPMKDKASSQILHVVLGEARKITKSMLSYVDEDWDSDPKLIKYSSIMTPMNKAHAAWVRNGEFLGNVYDSFVSLKRPIFSWTQADINEEKLVFIHEGTQTHGFLSFWVTDTKFTVNGTLEISASSPWVHIVNTTTLAAKQGSIQQLTGESLRVDTNMDVDQHNIVIRLVGGPQHGIIRVNGKATQNFTLGDVKSGFVYYENIHSTDDPKDYFQFKAVIGNNIESNVHEFDISIYPEAYWAPLTVAANESVLVNENSSAIISSKNVLVVNPHIPSNHIVYTLSKLPRHGYLAIEPKHTQDEADAYITMWDQTIINEGRLRYVQSEPNKTVDSMNFDVTNGVQTLHDLRIDFVVIPSTLLLASVNAEVGEGSSAVLNITHLHSAQNYFADKLGDVRLVNGPKHGKLSMISEPSVSVRIFSYSALQDGKIIYNHDGSETLHDQFTIVAQTIDLDTTSRISAGERTPKSSVPNIRTSQPFTLHIDIIPANDQVPKVVNNTGTWVWLGSQVAITNKELAAIDEDSDGHQLIYYVVEAVGGHLAVSSLPDVSLLNFTQDMINNGSVIFVHKGEDMSSTSFEFEVSDGLNEASKETFKITVRKPELIMYDGRVPLAIFPFTQSPIKSENLLVRSNDGREIVFQVTGGPVIGQLLTEHLDNVFLPSSSFSQPDINNGKIFYQHVKPFHGQIGNDFIRLTASSKYTDPLHNITLDVSVSVSGAALGGLQRYITVQPLLLKEGSQVAITNHNVNLTAVIDFISTHQRGNLWRNGMLSSLRLVLSEVPKHGWMINSADGHRLQYNDEISLPLLTRQSIKYFHDDSETVEDDIGLSLRLFTNDTISSSWLLNLTLPVTIIPVNDLPFQVAVPKGNTVSVVQEHWRKLNRNDLLTSDPDTPPSQIVYEVLKVSHGRLVLLSSLMNVSLPSVVSFPSSITNDYDLQDMEQLKELPSVSRFTQADVDAELVIFYHSGPVSPVLISLRVSDGQFPASPITLTIPVQPLTLQAAPSQASPLRIQQGNSVVALSVMNLPAATNGHLIHLIYNVTRLPLHGKLFLKDGISTVFSSSTFSTSKTAVTFNHSELSRGEIAYVQTDLSVANDSFEVGAYFNLEAKDESTQKPVSTTWLVNIVSVPLLKRVKEVRSFVKGFAVGGIIAPDETEFSAAMGVHTTLNLAVLDASPLAVVTGANPLFEILLPPKFGHIFKIPAHLNQNTFTFTPFKNENARFRRAFASQNTMARVTSRFSHEDIRRGSIIYAISPEMISNDLLPIRLTSNVRTAFSSSMADEFIFKVLAPGVQPALAIAKFNIRLHSGTRYYDDKAHNQIISDGSTDPATKTLANGDSSLRELIVASKESLITFGVIIVGVVTLSTFIIVGIRCTCSKDSNNQSPQQTNNQGTTNRNTKCNGGIGIIDAYTPSRTCAHVDQSCQSDSECSSHHLSHNPHSGTVLRPLLVSTLSPRLRNKVGNNSRTASDSGSWTSSGMRNDIPTPSMPQCRVTPLCNTMYDGSSTASDSGGNLATCPLLPPAPLCDTFSPLHEDVEVPEPYGFTYGSLNNTLPQPIAIDVTEVRHQATETVPFTEFQYPANTNNSGTLRRSTIQQNQYWV